jgi:hypothetical protein
MENTNLDSLAKEKGAILKIEVEDKIGYFKYPNRYVVGLFLAQLEDNRVQALETLLNGTIIESVSTLDLSNDEYFYAAMNNAQKLIDHINNNKKKSTSTLL